MEDGWMTDGQMDEQMDKQNGEASSPVFTSLGLAQQRSKYLAEPIY